MIALPSDSETTLSTRDKYKKKIQENTNILIPGISTVFIIALACFTNIFGYLKIALQPTNDTSICPLHDKLAPASFYSDNSTVLKIIKDEKFRLESVKKLAASVQVETVVFDGQPDVSKEPEPWLKFEKFHGYLKETFPTVFSVAEISYVNTYGIVIHWKGSHSRLKPLMLAAHQDVVPVQNGTLSDWTYPPFNGHYDGTYVYGRGASDCKNVLVAIMEALELLIEQDFQPQRSIIAAFGFDEEASGKQGAKHLARYLEDKFGQNSIYAIIDEGPGLQPDPFTSRIVATVATGEKGYLDLEVNLSTPGGHSSMPPDHTSIGIMSELVTILEKNPFKPILTTKNPILSYLQCLAIHNKKMPSLQRKAILRAGFDKLANSLVVKGLMKNPVSRYLIGTSQAADKIIGGEKANALPEYISLLVNHRIAVESSVEETINRFNGIIEEIAHKYKLGLYFKEQELLPETENGKFMVDFSSPLEPAPVSPSNDTIWKYLAGSVRHVFEDLIFVNFTAPIVTAPAIMPANTDTRYYWNLTPNIYRFSPFFSEDVSKENNIHSVDEKVRVDGHLQLLAFFYEYIQNVDTVQADN